jgi:hypothetical protein
LLKYQKIIKLTSIVYKPRTSGVGDHGATKLKYSVPESHSNQHCFLLKLSNRSGMKKENSPFVSTGENQNNEEEQESPSTKYNSKRVTETMSEAMKVARWKTNPLLQ